MTGGASISDPEFARISRLVYDQLGISLSPAKKPLVCGRLGKRLAHHGLNSYGEYLRLLGSGNGHELQIALDLLTTNETYFFRESRHFDFLRGEILPQVRPGRPLRLWSAACSSGEEPYSIAMVLADQLGNAPWEVLASDISSRMLERARSGLYAMERAARIPTPLLRAYCLKGVRENEGIFMIDEALRSRIEFRSINLNVSLPVIGEFDVIFLRNVMIYFDAETKRRVIQRISSVLRPGGYLLIGHSESLHGIDDVLRPIAPSIYRKP